MDLRLSKWACLSALTIFGISSTADAQLAATRPFDLGPATAPAPPAYRTTYSGQYRYADTAGPSYVPAYAASDPFARNDFEFSIGGQGFTARGPNGDDTIGFVTFDLGWYFVPNWSVDFQVGISPGSEHHRNDDGVRAVDEMALLRWHFLTTGPVSLFTDAGIGGLYATPDFPSGGRHNNFLMAVGGGAMLEFAPHCYGAIGARGAWLEGGDWDYGNRHHQWADGIQYYGNFTYIFP